MGSSKPCPGCGKVHERRKATEVCQDCKDKLKVYPTLKTELERINEGKIRFKIGRMPHLNRYFSVRYVDYKDSDIGRDLRESIYDVCMAGSVKGSTGDWTSDLPHIMSTDSYGSEMVRAAPQDFFDAIQTMMETVQKAIDLSYAAGQNDGSRFMVNIAEGKASIQDYDDRFSR